MFYQIAISILSNPDLAIHLIIQLKTIVSSYLQDLQTYLLGIVQNVILKSSIESRGVFRAMSNILDGALLKNS